MSGLASLWSLEGRWRLKRLIVHSDGTENRLEGKVDFHRSGARLIQDETGVLEMGGQKLTATRRYIWAEAEGRCDVFFEDMRPFHSVPLGAEQHQTTHLCAPDRYEVRYDFARWPNWTAHWRVEGPRKDYEMFSRLSPL